ncbi:hypothetical protein BGY98DRAFT_1011851, partial [Russula aff. rugulosa BPL654]
DSAKRSSRAHVFHFCSLLCEIASVLGNTPTGWIAERLYYLAYLRRKKGRNG